MGIAIDDLWENFNPIQDVVNWVPPGFPMDRLPQSAAGIIRTQTDRAGNSVGAFTNDLGPVPDGVVGYIRAIHAGFGGINSDAILSNADTTVQVFVGSQLYWSGFYTPFSPVPLRPGLLFPQGANPRILRNLGNRQTVANTMRFILVVEWVLFPQGQAFGRMSPSVSTQTTVDARATWS